MPQQAYQLPDTGAAYSLIVRFRREPGSVKWRAQLTDVQSGATTVLSIAPAAGDNETAVLATALAAAIARLLASPPHEEV